MAINRAGHTRRVHSTRQSVYRHDSVYIHIIVYAHSGLDNIFRMNNIIYTTLCKMQQIYYIHNVVQMQLISYIHNAFD